MRNTRKNIGLVTINSRLARTILAGASILLMAATTAAQPAPTTRPARTNQIVQDGVNGDGRITLTVGKSTVVNTRVPTRTVNIGQPEVADVNVLGPNTLLITAKKAGTTQLIIWDDQNRSQVVDILVDFDLQALQEHMKSIFPDAKIEVSAVGTGIALHGQVPNLQTAEQAAALASPYSERVLNFLEISGGQQVMLQVRFAEVSKSATSSLGVNLGFTDGTGYGGSNIGQVNAFGVEGTPPGDALTIASPNPAVTVFGRGQIGSTTLAAFVNALRQNNLLRMLAEPNLIAMSGQEANFLAGGEFPIPVTQGGATGAGGTAITVEYREFGVRLRMTPVVLGDGRIRLKVAPEVSDLDFTTAVRFGGFVIPGLTSRKVETTVELSEGQTFAIAGLLNNSTTATRDVTPVLGDIPILGALFRSVRYSKKETELVVLVTPRLVEALDPDQIPSLPGERWRDPNEADLFLHQDLGSEVAVKKGATTRPAIASADLPPEHRAAARFQGEWGFVPSRQSRVDLGDDAASAQE